MELSIVDRLAIPALLPKEGTFRQYNLKKSILAKIEIGEGERGEVNLRQNPDTNRIEWDTEKDAPRAVSFTSEEMEYLKDSCEKLADEPQPDYMWATIEGNSFCSLIVTLSGMPFCARSRIMWNASPTITLSATPPDISMESRIETPAATSVANVRNERAITALKMISPMIGSLSLALSRTRCPRSVR